METTCIFLVQIVAWSVWELVSCTCTCYHQMGACTRASGMMKAKHMCFWIIFLLIYLWMEWWVQHKVLVKAVYSLQSRSSLRGCYGEKQGYSFLMIWRIYCLCSLGPRGLLEEDSDEGVTFHWNVGNWLIDWLAFGPYGPDAPRT